MSLLLFFNQNVIPVAPPTDPTGLVATTVSSTKILLSWTASASSVGIAGYKIFRDGVLIGTSTTNSFLDTGLRSETTYAYTISSYDTLGTNSAQSAGASATTNPKWIVVDANGTGTIWLLVRRSDPAEVPS